MIQQLSQLFTSPALTRFSSASLVGIAALTNLVATPLLMGATQSSATASPLQVAAVGKSNVLPNGVYLHGEAPQPEQIGKTYTVFEVHQGRVVGAVYAPRSSFNCFQGRVEAGQLAVTVTDSYSKETYPYAVALESRALIASTQNVGLPKVGLQGMYPIATISANDRRILGVCKASYQN